MAVTSTTRFGLPQWSAGSDPPINRAQATAAFLALSTNAAGWVTPDIAANRPAAAAGNAGFFFRATDTGAVSLSSGSAWFNIPTGTFLALSGGTLTGFLDMATQELRNATVLQARNKVVTASVSGAVVIDAAAAAEHILTMTGNVTSITVNNLNSGEALKVTWIEDATGGRTIAFPGSWLWTQGAAVATVNFKTTANAVNVLQIEKSGSQVQAFLAGDMKV
jgi:hypothetical protein